MINNGLNKNSVGSDAGINIESEIKNVLKGQVIPENKDKLLAILVGHQKELKNGNLDISDDLKQAIQVLSEKEEVRPFVTFLW